MRAAAIYGPPRMSLMTTRLFLLNRAQASSRRQQECFRYRLPGRQAAIVEWTPRVPIHVLFAHFLENLAEIASDQVQDSLLPLSPSECLCAQDVLPDESGYALVRRLREVTRHSVASSRHSGGLPTPLS
jgi:hypothetical protein